MNIEPLEDKALRATQIPEGCTAVMFDGAIRSSKTISEILLWVDHCRNGPKGQLAIVGRTETTVINNIILPLQDMLGSARVVLNRGLGIVTILGRVCQIYGANDEAARTKIQGLSLAGALVDEAANIPESFLNMLWSRLSVPGAMLFLTCNPEGPKHYLKTKWLDRAAWYLDKAGVLHDLRSWDDEGQPIHLPIYRVTFLLDDNKALARNNPTFVAQLKRSWPAGSVFHRRYILSEWVSAEGAVYPMWNEPTMTLQAAELPPIDQVLIAALDYGTTHQTRAYLLAMTRVNIDPHTGAPDWLGSRQGIDMARSRQVLIVLDEFAPESATVGEHARLFELWLATNAHYGQPEWLAIDPAAATFKMELYARGRSDVMNAHNAVVPGIQTVQSLLYGGHLFVVGDRCPKLVSAFPAYMWDTKATDKGLTRPVKDQDDEVDAVRYAVYSSRRYWREAIPLAPTIDQDTEEMAA